MNTIVERIDEAASGLLAEHNCPGMAVAVLSGPDTEYRAYGLANVEQQEPVTEATLFQVCSISKAVSAWGVMRLVDEGRLDLDAPVEEYLSRWHLPETEFDNREVTVRRLLSHTAGLPVEGYTGIPPTTPLPTIEEVLNGKTPPMDESQLAYIRKWGFDPETKHQPVRIVQRPGQEFSYSGGGYLLLDLILEEITGGSVAQFLNSTVLAPLGLENSTFETLNPDLPSYAMAYDEELRPLPRYRFIHITAGGMSADIRDLARFVRAEFAGPSVAQIGQGVVTPQSFGMMFEPVIFAETAGGMDFDMGLGHFLGSINGRRLVQHSGGSTGWRSIYFALPDLDQGFAALINSSAGNEVWQALARIWAEAL